jgi:hypothetical protein
MGFKIESIYAFVSIDADDEEGVCAANIGPGGSMVPLIAADEARLESIRYLANGIAKECNVKVKLIKMTERQELLIINPDGTQLLAPFH